MTKQQEPESVIWKRYLALQLTPEQRAEARKRLEAEVQPAAAGAVVPRAVVAAAAR